MAGASFEDVLLCEIPLSGRLLWDFVKLRSLERQTDLERFDKRVARVVDADKAEQKPEADDEVVVGDVFLVHQVSLELQVEVARPDEAQHGTREAADEAHQDREMGDEAGHQDSEHDDADAPHKPPNLQLAVELPNLRENRLRLAAEERALEKFTRCKVRQWIAQHGFDHEAKVHQSLEAR